MRQRSRRGLRLSRALEDPPGLGPKRGHVSRPQEIGGLRSRDRSPSGSSIARSAAEIPVVVRPRASMETVNAVPKLDVLFSTMGGSCNRSQRSAVRARQMSPRPSRAMKLMAGGVTFSAR